MKIAIYCYFNRLGILNPPLSFNHSNY